MPRQVGTLENALHERFSVVAATSQRRSSGRRCLRARRDGFFRLDPDGMRYFGGSGSDPTGTQFSMMCYIRPELLLKNPVTTAR